MLKTKFEDIVNVGAIGKKENPIDTNALLTAAGKETVRNAASDSESVLLVGIDFQYDFLEGGSLAVSGGCGDVERMARFIYDNFSKITSREYILSLNT